VKRRGPALPGFRNMTPFRVIDSGTVRVAGDDDVKLRRRSVEIELTHIVEDIEEGAIYLDNVCRRERDGPRTFVARTAWSSCATGAPNSAMIPAPMTWFTVPS
jgi:hypothetical protein